MAGGDSSSSDEDEDVDWSDDIVKDDDNDEREGTHSIDDGSIVIVDFRHHAKLLF